MERKTKKMVEIEKEILTAGDQVSEINLLLEQLMKYEPNSGKAQDLREQEISRLRDLRNTHSITKDCKREELELATVEMLAGKDTDFAEPTPASALRDAS